MVEEASIDYCVEGLNTFLIMATKKKDHKQVNASFLTLQSAIVVGAITFDYLVSKGNLVGCCGQVWGGWECLRGTR